MPAKQTACRLIHGTGKNTGARKVIGRIVAIAIETARPGGVRVSELAARLEICSKTVHRDLDFMRDNLMLELTCKSGRWTLHHDHVERVQGIRAVFANITH